VINDKEVTVMKKLGKSTKKGFTLVELIVVLVILAVLAAMLVPALVGYIDRARDEKEFQTAATIYGAAQAVVTEKYAKDSSLKSGAISKQATSDPVLKLAGVAPSAVSSFSFTYGKNYIISGGKVKINGSTYKLTITDGVPKWEAGKNVN
jgi:type IV pilus assembly protein PilA